MESCSVPSVSEVVAAYLATNGYTKTLPAFLSEAKLKTFQEKDGFDLESMYKNYVSSKSSGSLTKQTPEKVKDIVKVGKERRQIYQVVDTSQANYSITIETPCQDGQESNLVVGAKGLQKEGKRKRQNEVLSDEEVKQRKKKKRSVEDSEKVTLDSLEEGLQGVVVTTENGFKKGKEKSKKKKNMEAQLEESGKDKVKKGIDTESTLLGEEDAGKSSLNGVVDERNVELDIHKLKDGEAKEGELGDTMDGNILNKREEKSKKKKKESRSAQSDVLKLNDGETIEEGGHGNNQNEDILNKKEDKSKKKREVQAFEKLNDGETTEGGHGDTPNEDGLNQKKDKSKKKKEAQSTPLEEQGELDVQKLKDGEPNEDGLNKRKDKSKKKKKKEEEEGQENGSVDAKIAVNDLQSELPEVIDSEGKDGRKQRKSKKSKKLSEEVQSALPNDGVDVKMDEISHASEFEEPKDVEEKQLEKHGKKKKSKDTIASSNGHAENTNNPEMGGGEPELDGLSEKKKQKKRKTKVAEEKALPQEVDNLVPSVKQNGDLTQVNSISELLSENSQNKLQNGSNETEEMENADQKMPKSLEKKPTGALAFRRVDPEKVAFDDPRLQDNSYWAKAGAEEGWGAKAQGVLGTVRGKDFRHEKTKKKRGSYMGGKIDLQSHSVKFNFSDGE